MLINNTLEVQNMSIEIISGNDAIRQVIASISTRATAYKAVVSSAVLSSLQHYRAHNDYTLLQETMDTVFQINYRDYAAVVDFIKSMTWVGLTMENRGRRQHYTIVGELTDAMGPKPSDTTVKEWADKVKRVRDNIIVRQGLFDDFAQGKPTKVKNPDWSKGMDVNQKHDMVNYNQDIFKWHDDVKWLRNDGTGGATPGNGAAAPRTLSKEATDKVAYDLEEKLMKTLNKPVVPVLIHMIDRFESETSVIATDEELESLQASFNLFMKKVKIRSEIAAKQKAEQQTVEGGNENQPENAETSEDASEPTNY